MKAVEKGILIHRSSFSETSLLVTLLLETHGLTTFLFQGGKKKKGNMLFPMAHVEITYFKRSDSSLAKISEINLLDVSTEIPFNPVKSGIAFFMAELVQHLVRPGHAENGLYQLLAEEIRWLDHSHELTNYPLWLLAAYCKESGFSPIVEAKNPTVLDLPGGKLTTVRPSNPNYVEGEWIHWLEASLGGDKNAFLSMQISRTERILCFDAWMLFLRSHVTGTKAFRSADIIREVLAG